MAATPPIIVAKPKKVVFQFLSSFFIMTYF